MGITEIILIILSGVAALRFRSAGQAGVAKYIIGAWACYIVSMLIGGFLFVSDVPGGIPSLQTFGMGLLKYLIPPITGFFIALYILSSAMREGKELLKYHALQPNTTNNIPPANVANTASDNKTVAVLEKQLADMKAQLNSMLETQATPTPPPVEQPVSPPVAVAPPIEELPVELTPPVETVEEPPAPPPVEEPPVSTPVSNIAAATQTESVQLFAPELFEPLTASRPEPPPIPSPPIPPPTEEPPEPPPPVKSAPPPMQKTITIQNAEPRRLGTPKWLLLFMVLISCFALFSSISSVVLFSRLSSVTAEQYSVRRWIPYLEGVDSSLQSQVTTLQKQTNDLQKQTNNLQTQANDLRRQLNAAEVRLSELRLEADFLEISRQRLWAVSELQWAENNFRRMPESRYIGKWRYEFQNSNNNQILHLQPNQRFYITSNDSEVRVLEGHYYVASRYITYFHPGIGTIALEPNGNRMTDIWSQLSTTSIRRIE